MTNSNEEFLKTYDAKEYKTPDGYTADMAVFTITSKQPKKGKKPIRELKIMLIKRSSENNIEAGKWALPGGFVKHTEKGHEGAVRELKEEATISGFHLSHFGVYDAPGRDPRGWIISNAFYAIVKEEVLAKRQANDDAEEVELFTLDEVFELDLAFDHRDIITDAIKVVKRDLLTTTLAKHFLPDEFILSQLRDLLLLVSEEIRNRKETAFVRKAKKFPFLAVVMDQNGNEKTSQQYSYQPTTLYRFNEVQPEVTIY